MLKLEIIGNLGAAAVLKKVNDSQFVSFRVAHTRKFTNKQTGEVTEETVWVSCTLNGNGGNLLPFLQSGTKVFVRGYPSARIFTSQRDGQPHAGWNLFVEDIELCGSRPQQQADGNDIPY